MTSEQVIQARMGNLKSRKTPQGQFVIEFRGTSNMAGFLNAFGSLDIRGQLFTCRTPSQAKRIIAENWDLFTFIRQIA